MDMTDKHRIAPPEIPAEAVSVAEVPLEGAPAAPEGGISPFVWVVGLVVAVGAILWYFTR